MSKFEDFRNQYNSFLYKDYSVEYIESAYRIVYHFEIPGLCEFQSKWEFPAKERVDETILKALAFSWNGRDDQLLEMCLPEAVKNFVWNTFRRTEKMVEKVILQRTWRVYVPQWNRGFKRGSCYDRM